MKLRGANVVFALMVFKLLIAMTIPCSSEFGSF